MDQESGRVTVLGVVGLGLACLAGFVIKSYLDYSKWNNGRCKTCGSLLSLHKKSRGVESYVCSSCDKIACEMD